MLAERLRGITFSYAWVMPILKKALLVLAERLTGITILGWYTTLFNRKRWGCFFNIPPRALGD